MAVYSMTGYAIAASAAPSREGAKGAAVASVTVEARSVNGRFLDLSFRLPDELRGLEPAQPLGFQPLASLQLAQIGEGLSLPRIDDRRPDKRIRMGPEQP